MKLLLGFLYAGVELVGHTAPQNLHPKSSIVLLDTLCLQQEEGSSVNYLQMRPGEAPREVSKEASEQGKHDLVSIAHLLNH